MVSTGVEEAKSMVERNKKQGAAGGNGYLQTQTSCAACCLAERMWMDGQSITPSENKAS